MIISSWTKGLGINGNLKCKTLGLQATKDIWASGALEL